MDGHEALTIGHRELGMAIDQALDHIQLGRFILLAETLGVQRLVAFEVRSDDWRVLVAAQALQEAPPARQAGQHQRQHVVHTGEYAIVRRRAHSLSIQVFQRIKKRNEN